MSDPLKSLGRLVVDSNRTLGFDDLVAAVASAARAQGEDLTAMPDPYSAFYCETCGCQCATATVLLAEGNLLLRCANPKCGRILASLWLARAAGSGVRTHVHHPQAEPRRISSEQHPLAHDRNGNPLRIGDEVLILSGARLPLVGRVIAFHEEVPWISVAVPHVKELLPGRVGFDGEIRVEREANLELVGTMDNRHIQHGPLAGYPDWGAAPLSHRLLRGRPRHAVPPGGPVDHGVDSSSGGEEG